MRRSVQRTLFVVLTLLAGAGAGYGEPLEPGPPIEARMNPQTAPVSAAAQAEMIAVPGGAYPIGDTDARPSARPAHTVELDAFAIDRTEVTNAAFAEFLNALDLTVHRPFAVTEAVRADFGPDTRPELLEEGRNDSLYPLIGLDDPEVRIAYRDGRFAPAAGHGDHPAAEVTWRGARDYCLWRGARLPSEVEWEAAARGKDGRRYPWGEAPPTDARVHAGHRSGNTAPVASHPKGATPSGIHDMAGSLAEWTASLFRPYPYDRADGRESPTHPGERTTRGGDYVFDTAPETLTTYFRDGFSRAPTDGHRHIGFRCAADRP